MSHDFLAGAVKYGLFHPAQALVLLAAAALLLRFKVKPWWAWTVTGFGALAFVLQICLKWPGGTDLRWFWLTGRDVLAGVDPYHYEFCVWPPTAFPLFALFALLPFAEILAVWTIVNILGHAALLVVAQRVLYAAAGSERSPLPAHVLGVLTAALMLSVSCGYGMEVAQVSLGVTFAVFLALWARYCGRPGLAALGLAVASIKAATMLPFLLLFRRRQDRLTWLALPLTCVMLYLLVNPAGDMVVRLGECLRNIAVLSTPGHMNNFAHPVNADMVAFDRAIFFLGVDDRTMVRLAQAAVVLVLGGWVAYEVMRRSRLREPAACSLVAFYAALFFYHRLYDMPILALPLLYAFGRAQIASGWARWLYTASASAVLGVMYVRLETVKELSYQPRLHPLLEALVVPHGTWLAVAGLVCLLAAERLGSKAMASSLDIPDRMAA